MLNASMFLFKTWYWSLGIWSYDSLHDYLDILRIGIGMGKTRNYEFSILFIDGRIAWGYGSGRNLKRWQLDAPIRRVT